MHTGGTATRPTTLDGARRADHRHRVVLLVEDNEADVELTREALAGSALGTQLRVVGDGLEALAYLRRAGEEANGPRPDLILLDLNMPRLDGRGVLEAMKWDTTMQDIPVVVLSSSAAPDDVRTAYRLRANCYVTKPVGLTAYLAMITAIEHFWFTVATPPPAP